MNQLFELSGRYLFQSDAPQRVALFLFDVCQLAGRHLDGGSPERAEKPVEEIEFHELVRFVHSVALPFNLV